MWIDVILLEIMLVIDLVRFGLEIIVYLVVLFLKDWSFFSLCFCVGCLVFVIVWLGKIKLMEKKVIIL